MPRYDSERNHFHKCPKLDCGHVWRHFNGDIPLKDHHICPKCKKGCDIERHDMSEEWIAEYEKTHPLVATV